MQQSHDARRDSPAKGKWRTASERAQCGLSWDRPITAAFVSWGLGVESVPPEYRRHRYLTFGEADRQNIDPVQ